MARLPTKASLSQPASLRTGTAISSADMSAIARGGAALGAGLSALAESRSRKQNALDIARAEAFYTEQSLDLQNRYQQDGDYGTFADRAPKETGGIVDKAADLIRDDELRERWKLQQQPKVARLNDSIFDIGNALQEQDEIVNFDKALETNRRIYVDPNTTEANKQKALRDIEASITVARESGLLTPAQAEAKRKAFVEDAQLTRGLLETKQNPDVLRAGDDPASILRGFEGFSATAYWDENAYRAGFGSDTTTRADGTVEKIQPGTIVTRADAERDLQRRVVEFQNTVIGQIGQERWSQFPANVQAALTSVAYNYGSLPDRILDEVKNGGPEDIARAVTGLQNDNGGINAHRRQREARIIMGDVNPAWFNSLSPEQQRVVKDQSDRSFAEQASAFEAQRNAAMVRRKEDVSLGILTGDIVSEQQILDDPLLDSGDKATLLRSFRSEKSAIDASVGYIAGLEDGSARVLNPLDSGDRKLADKAFTTLRDNVGASDVPALTTQFFERSGVLPDSAQNDILNNANSSDKQSILSAAQLSSSLYAANRHALTSTAKGRDIADIATSYDFYTEDMGLTPEQASQKLADLNDPAKLRERELLLKSESVKEFIEKKSDPSTILKEVGGGGFLGSGFGEASFGANDTQAAVMTADYRRILEESLVDANGDQDLASKLASERFSRTHGRTALDVSGSDIVTKLPPETVYPVGADGTHSYIREQTVEALKGEGIEVEANKVFLQPFGETEKNFNDGIPPRYEVLYEKDGLIETYHLPFFADTSLENEKAASEKQDRVKRDKLLRDENRVRQVEEDRIEQVIIEGEEQGLSDFELEQKAKAEMDRVLAERRARQDTLPKPVEEVDPALEEEQEFMRRMSETFGFMGGGS